MVTVAGGVTTASFEGLWEQTTAGAWKTSYTFNGQVVALRDSATNAVTYLHGDHLGSVSVTTNASGTANVQEYDPWGSVRAGSMPQTTLSFTGQQLDGTDLLYYRARMYDPVLARFVSPDNIAPGKDNPQLRNRYSYVINNPLRYTDPTGHCAEGYDETLEGCGKYLQDHGWNVVLSDWVYDQLKMVVQSVLDLKTAAGWSTADYRNTMTANGKYQLQLNRESANAKDANRPAQVEGPGWFSSTITMTVYDALFAGDKALQLVNLVHEQAHVWDDATNGAMSENMMNATGSYYSWWGLGSYVAVGETSSKYLTDHYEDWAETVAAAIYPTHPRFAYPDGKPRMGKERENYIRSFLPNGAIFKS